MRPSPPRGGCRCWPTTGPSWSGRCRSPPSAGSVVRAGWCAGMGAMRVLITGITGMAGSHLADYCLSRGDVEVVGTIRWRSPRNNIAHCADRVRLMETDLRDQAGVRRLLEEIQPDAIFHLAAQSFVPASWTGTTDTLMTNVLAQVHLLEAMRDLNMTDVPMQIAGSSEEYGLVHPEETPITEENPLRPLSPYAVSKVTQDMLGWQYHQSFGLRTVRTRAFNHEGPGQGASCPDPAWSAPRTSPPRRGRARAAGLWGGRPPPPGGAARGWGGPPTPSASGPPGRVAPRGCPGPPAARRPCRTAPASCRS